MSAPRTTLVEKRPCYCEICWPDLAVDPREAIEIENDQTNDQAAPAPTSAEAAVAFAV